MFHEIVRPLEATDPLARLFNAYLKGLSTPAIFCEPTYTTMHEVRSLYLERGKTKEREHLYHAMRRYYELMVLGNSLRSIHGHVLDAIELLEGFFESHDGDLLSYATTNRLHLLNEYGSEDDSDWEEDGLDEQGKPRWKVAYKDDPKSLEHYTLYAELGRCFGHGDTRGEFIGTSHPSDFYPYTTLVAEQSTFSFRKMLEAVAPDKPVQITQLQADGSMTPMSLGDHLERELNEDLAGAEVVRRFEAVLLCCAHLGSHYLRMTNSSPAVYQKLLEALRCVRDVETEPIAPQP